MDDPATTLITFFVCLGVVCAALTGLLFFLNWLARGRYGDAAKKAQENLLEARKKLGFQ